ncbi:OB-fold nucleic acid binding domain protein [Halogeometricum pallidum JCM 14848]|uniref:OB-fold nucleic acid binding domain protein n=1 Tax=Halogeometricum pallidum JCM 14848 TaxID=1227487 RepID=M0CV10_HALPD|nr:OB-fold nucleic acid binding domain protein [Halogeometricum pallidum JCM 14848]
MSTTRQIGYEGLDEQVDEQTNTEAEQVELRPSVELERQGLIDSSVAERGRGLTLAAEERLAAREFEIERTRMRMDAHQMGDREERTRAVVEKTNEERRRDFQIRAGCVDRWTDPKEADPREELSKEQLAAVNRQAMRIHESVPNSGSTAAIARQLAERVADGDQLMSTVIAVAEAEERRPESVVPIRVVGDVNSGEVTVEGEVEMLWEPSNSAIQDAGLLKDETGTIKFVSWKKSGQPAVREGERVRFRCARKKWYDGTCSLALTSWSDVEVVEYAGWWTE